MTLEIFPWIDFVDVGPSGGPAMPRRRSALSGGSQLQDRFALRWWRCCSRWAEAPDASSLGATQQHFYFWLNIPLWQQTRRDPSCTSSRSDLILQPNIQRFPASFHLFILSSSDGSCVLLHVTFVLFSHGRLVPTKNLPTHSHSFLKSHLSSKISSRGRL